MWKSKRGFFFARAKFNNIECY